MRKRIRAPIIYLSHPRPSAGSASEARALRTLSRAFPNAKILNAARLYPSMENWLHRYRRQIARASALVFFAWGGTIGYGVYREVATAEDRAIPTLLLAGGKLYNTWTLSILSHRNQLKHFARVRPRGHAVLPAEIVLRPPRRGLLPSGPLGRVIENHAIEYLLVFSEGRLIVYRPESDFEGTDLHVSLVHQRAVLKIQVKGRTAPATARFLRFGVRPQTIPPGDPKYLLFLHYDLARAELLRFAWLIPADEYREKARLVHGEYKSDLSTKATAADKWVDYRYNVKDVAWVVEELLKRAEGGNTDA